MISAGGASIERSGECLMVSNMDKGCQIQIRVPHTYHAAAELLVCFSNHSLRSLLAL